MAEAQLRRRFADRSQRAHINGAVDRGGGDRRRFPAAHPVSARRLPLCAATDDPAPDPILTASLPERYGISRLPQVEDESADKRKFKTYPIGYFHIDIAEVRTAQGKLYLFVAIDRTSKFVFVALHEKADRPTAACFLEALIAAVPYRLHTVLTDNGIQFADLPRNRDGWTARYRVHRFDQICRAHGIEHRLTKPNHPWTNGQVERMNRTIKEATVNRYHYESHEQLRTHLADFVTAYNFARRLKVLKGLSPYEYLCSAWTKEPGRFILDPIHQMPGPNT
jgi:transposase InsO family protein